MTQGQLAEAIGTSQNQIYLHETGRTDPKLSSLEKIANVLGVSLSYLVGADTKNDERQNSEHTLPVVSSLAKIDVRTSVDKRQAVSQTLYNSHPNSFLLVVRGNSMNRLFHEGALVLVDPMEKAKNGDVVVVKFKENNALIRRIYFDDDGVVLSPESYDEGYMEVFVPESDRLEVIQIIGKVISYTAPDDWRA